MRTASLFGRSICCHCCWTTLSTRTSTIALNLRPILILPRSASAPPAAIVPRKSVHVLHQTRRFKTRRRRRSDAAARIIMTTAAAAANSENGASACDVISTTNPLPAMPPVARRCDSSFILAGSLASLTESDLSAHGIDPTVPRQPGPENDDSESSEESSSSNNSNSSNSLLLLDPPRRLPNPYGWMRSDDRSSREVLDHLRAENDYTAAIMGHVTKSGGLRDKLYDELVDGLQETDYTTPSRDGRWWYYRRTYEGKSYGVHCRAPVVDADVADDADADDDACATATTNTPGRDGTTVHPIIAWDHTTDGAAKTPILPDERIYLDENALADGRDYCATGSVVESPSQDLLAYTVDFSGDEIYELRVRDISAGGSGGSCSGSGTASPSGTGNDIDDDDKEVPSNDHRIEGLEVDGTVVWGSDDTTLYYLRLDAQHRPYQVWRHVIGTDPKEDDVMIFEELDDTYWVSIAKSSDRRYLFVDCSSAETSEVHYLDLTSRTMDGGAATEGTCTETSCELQCVAKRRKRVLYEVEHRNGRWLISTNYSNEMGEDGNNKPTANFRLMSCEARPDSEDGWVDMKDENEEIMFTGDEERALDHVQPFRRHAVAVGREGGIPRVWILRFGGAEGKEEDAQTLDVVNFTRLDFPEEAYDVGLGPNYEYTSTELVLSYDSLITPLESILIDMDDPDNVDARRVLKQKNVPGYDKSLYGCERTTVTARDGSTEIPVSLVYRKDVMEKHTASGRTVPVHLYGYGSYGSNVEADFSSTRLPLLKRGMVYVLAHVRGGGEMGRQWYEEPNGAKFLCKKNTFNDFVDVARWLVEDRKLTSPAQLSCEGRSAGGLLIGASVNQAPRLFGVAILGVPFVDVVPTMIDASIPLTAGEWEEWGCPNEEKYFEYMMSYCPMHNVQEGVKYPAMLLTGGLHDPRVQYWEPAKFAAVLRHNQGKESGSGPVCLKIDMSAGHFSASDRYKYLKELSFDYAFLLDQLGIANGRDK
mmetsp:Transcript_27427/g.60932  ORF Transcript_27427/g.60932 Transcript_27427/m.60932 type:complete len:990 (-) Transcript_27427:1315-4284(-)